MGKIIPCERTCILWKKKMLETTNQSLSILDHYELGIFWPPPGRSPRLLWLGISSIPTQYGVKVLPSTNQFDLSMTIKKSKKIKQFSSFNNLSEETPVAPNFGFQVVFFQQRVWIHGAIKGHSNKSPYHPGHGWPWLSIDETYGDFGIPHFTNHPNIHQLG